jgi:predicted peptidase
VPCHYATETAKYPLLLFLNGALEGSQYGNLSKLMTVGPPVFIADSMRFAFDVAGTNYKMIVVAPQSPTGFRNPQAVNTIIDYMIAHYRIDESRIYLTGVSAGAQSVLTYLSDNVDNAKRIAAAAPMSSTELDATHINNLKIIGQQGVHTQIFCGDADGKYFNINKSYVDGINQGASGMGIFTTYSGAHGEWNNQYDPSHRYRNPNVYEWLLQFHR